MDTWGWGPKLDPSGMFPPDIQRRWTGKPKLPDPVGDAANDALGDFITGGDRSYAFGPAHEWTQQLRQHPHMTTVRDQIVEELRNYCKNRSVLERPPQGRPNFNLNKLPPGENLKWLGKDILSWITNGDYGTPKAYVFGSFRLHWEVAWPVLCCKRVALVMVTANDTLRLGSATRIPKTKFGLPDEPFGKNAPFNNIDVQWRWAELITF